MKKNTLLPGLAFSLLLFSSCGQGSADKRVPELANEMCGCFTDFQKGLTADGVALLKTVGASASPQTEMTAGMGKLKQQEAMDFAKKLQSLGDSKSEVYACMEAFDKKHGKETTKSKGMLKRNLLKELQQKNDCFTAAAMINLDIHRSPDK
jgi:hypothetical protein